MLGSWPVIDYQRIVQNTSQAGNAVHVAQRYNATAPEDRLRLQFLAVHTLGFTYPGMALAKLLRFLLCPQLAHLPEKKLFVLTGVKVPDAIEDIVHT